MAIVIIIAGVIVRLIGVVRPILGNFATKGIAYAMIAKNFVTDPGTVLYPTFNILINGKPSLHMTEWPFYAYVVGVIQKILPWGNVDITGRAVSVAFFAISAWFLFPFLPQALRQDYSHLCPSFLHVLSHGHNIRSVCTAGSIYDVLYHGSPL